MSSAPTYYCRFPSGEIRGPVNESAIKREIKAGEFPPDFMVSRDAKGPWVPFSELLEKGDDILPEVTMATAPLQRPVASIPRPSPKSIPPTVPLLATFFQGAAVLAVFGGLCSGMALGYPTGVITGASLIFGAAPLFCWMGSVITLLDRIARNGEAKP